MPDYELVASLDDLPEGEPLGVETLRGERICLVNTGDSVIAVSNVCTHQEFAMSAGTIHPDGVIECAWHGARFDLRSGEVLLGPAEVPLPTYEVRVEDGNVLVGPIRR